MKHEDWQNMMVGEIRQLDDNHMVMRVPTGWVVETFIYDRDKYGLGSGDVMHLASVFVPNERDM